jgi:hypothetical protein
VIGVISGVLWGGYAADRASAAIGATLYGSACRAFLCQEARFPREVGVRIIAILALAIALAGCAIADKIAARNEYQKSADSYRQCMAANPTAPQQCEEQRLAMEAVERKRDSISTDIDWKLGTPPPDYASAQ